jgi:hypothetical protein
MKWSKELTDDDLAKMHWGIEGIRKMYPDKFVISEDDLRWAVCSENNVTRNLPDVSGDCSNQDKAIAYSVIAGRELYMKHRGGSFFKQDLQNRALLLWARDKVRAQGVQGEIDDDDPKVQRVLSKLPEINWPRVYRMIGLNKEIVKDAPRGRKRKEL